MSLYSSVYGLDYKSATEQMQLVSNAIKQQQGKGFQNITELLDWAKSYNLDKLVFSSMNHKFMYVSHKGEIMNYASFKMYYDDVLYYTEIKDNVISRTSWAPTGFEYYDRAYIVGECSDGVHLPLYYRDYTIPTGYYSQEKDAFNIAKPFPVFAEETGRDTSFIYTYIEHLAGECAYHLLAWLRAKLLYPTIKTQIVPIIVSKAQGSGKTTFAEVICKGLFGKDNVIVSDQYDSTARFNADYADALIVCQEEKEETDRRNPAGALKSRATATTIRKEQKGIDPIYQESYTDFIMTTNKDVPIKFDGREDQRRFMIMEADEHFTRKESDLADEVFTKLYGYDANYNKCGLPFQEDRDLIAQFKHELFTRADIAAVELRNFPKTAAYKKCFTLPRTSEATDIESIMRALAPFIKDALVQKKINQEVNGQQLNDVIQYVNALQYMPAYKEHSAFIAICRPLVFYELGTMKPYTHSVVERAIYDCGAWLIADFGIAIVPDMEPLLGGFTNVVGRYRTAPAAKFCLMEDVHKNPIGNIQSILSMPKQIQQRIGKRLAVDKSFNVNDNGCFETVNELKPGIRTLANKNDNVQYMDTFLLESDDVTKVIQQQEQLRANDWIDKHGEGSEIRADVLYKERLHIAYTESMQLFNSGIVARVVYSGAKSYHLLIRVADAPNNMIEYKWLHSYLCTNISNKLIFDESTADPARLTRSPLTLDRVTSMYNLLVYGEQKLIVEDWSHLYTLDWRVFYNQWCNRPLTKIESKKGKPLYPTRPEYLEAVTAIIEGTFWTDTKFDENRQRLFFPSYRLLRLVGYTHDEIWQDIVIPNLDTYKKKNEIGYWKTRANSRIIIQIDNEFDEFNELMESKND